MKTQISLSGKPDRIIWRFFEIILLIAIHLPGLRTAGSAIPWLIDFVSVSNSTDPSSPTYINDYPVGSTRAGVFCPGMAALPEKDLFVMTSFMPNDIKTNIRIFNRNSELKLTYQTGFRGHQYAFVKNWGTGYSLISSIWWSSTSDIMWMRQTLQISAAGVITIQGGAFISTSDRIVQTVDLPGTRFIFGIGISFVFKFDGTTSNMETFRSLPGANNYPSFLGPFNNGQTLLVVYAPMRWATFSTLELAPVASNTVATNLGTMTVDNLNQMTAFAVTINPIVLCRRDLSAATFSTLDSLSLGSVGLSAVLNLGTFDLLLLVPSVVERMPIDLQNSLVFAKKSALQLFSYQPPGYVLDSIFSTLMGPSIPSDIDFGMRFYFAFVRDTFYNLQSYYMLMDTCMSLDGLTLTCTKCPVGYWRAGSSFPAPRRCLSPKEFPASTGMNNITNTFESCTLGVSCKSCLYDYQSCISCDTQAGYFLDSISGLCVLKSNFPDRVGLNPWNRRISACHDNNCIECRDNIYICQICDTPSGFYLNLTTARCQNPATFAKGFGVSQNNNSIVPCLDSNCLSCAPNAAVCLECNLQSSWYLNSTSGSCQTPTSFLQGFGVGVWSKMIESCQDFNCKDCRGNSQECVLCDQSTGYYLNSTSKKCMLPSNFANGFGAASSNFSIQSCTDPQCLDCRFNYQICTMCNVLADWYLNTTSGVCQQPSTFSSGFGVNTTSRLIQSCSDPNCIDCNTNNRLCFACNTASWHYWDSASLRCLNATEFPRYFGLELTNMIVGRCADPNCLECPSSTTLCVKCDSQVGRYLASNTGTCVTLAEFLPKHGVELSSGKVVPCADPKCLACSNDHLKCTQCDTVGQYYLNQTRMSCQQPTDFDAGYGVDLITNQIAKCVDPNCIKCETDIHTCVCCNTLSGWYLNTTTSSCQSPTQFSPGFGVDSISKAFPTIKKCKQTYCLECAFDRFVCQKCDVSSNYYLNTSSNLCQTPETFETGYGVNQFSHMIDRCVDSHCSDCHIDTRICTWCKPDAGWYLNTGSGNCLQLNEFPTGFGINSAKNTLENCIDSFCLDCRNDVKVCLKCDTDKNYFLNQSTGICQSPQSFDQGFGVDLQNRSIKVCLDKNCIDCSPNYEACRKCDTNRQFFLHSSGRCVEVTRSTPLFRAGANLLTGKIEPCADASCDSCVLDSRICSGCDFLNGFKLEGDVCVQSSSEKPKLRFTTSNPSTRTVRFEFYEPVKISNITNFFKAFKVWLTDKIHEKKYLCTDSIADPIPNTVLCSAEWSNGVLEIHLLSELDLLAARMYIEDPNRIGVIPNGTIVGEKSSKLFTDYPLSAPHVITSAIPSIDMIAGTLGLVYNWRSIVAALLYLVSPRLGVWVERSLSHVNYLGYLEGKIITYPDLLFSQYLFLARIGGSINDRGLWNSDWDSSRCQTNPSLWRRAIKCSIFTNLNSEVFFGSTLICFGVIMYITYLSLAKRLQVLNSSQKIFPMQSKTQISSKHDQNLLMSERADVSPSVEDSHKDKLEPKTNHEHNIMSKENECEVAKGREIEDEFEDLPLQEEPDSGNNRPETKDFSMKIPKSGEIAIKSEHTPVEWGDSEQQIRDIKSAGLPKLRKVKPVAQADFGSRSSVLAGSPSFQQSMFSLEQTPARSLEKPTVVDLPEADDPVAAEPALQPKPVAKIVEPKAVLSSPRSKRLALFLWTNGLQFVFARFEATQQDFLFLGIVNLYYYSAGVWELAGTVLSLFVVAFYVWTAKKAWDLFIRFRTISKSKSEKQLAYLLQSDIQNDSVSLGYYFDEVCQSKSPIFVLMPLVNFVRCFLLARFLVAMFEFPIVQTSLVILTEVAYTIYVWKYNSSPHRAEAIGTNFMNVIRLLYICFKLVLETNVTSEKTNQLIIGYAMAILVSGMVAIILALPTFIITCKIWHACFSKWKSTKSSSTTPPSEELKTAHAPPSSKPLEQCCPQDVELSNRQGMPMMNPINSPEQQGQQQPAAEIELDRLPTLKRTTPVSRRPVQTQNTVQVVVRPAPKHTRPLAD